LEGWVGFSLNNILKEFKVGRLGEDVLGGGEKVETLICAKTTYVGLALRDTTGTAAPLAENRNWEEENEEDLLITYRALWEFLHSMDNRGEKEKCRG